MKVADLEGARLDYWVAKALGMTTIYCHGTPGWLDHGPSEDYSDAFQPSQRWGHGGPIIEREGIQLAKCTAAFFMAEHVGYWVAAPMQIGNLTHPDDPQYIGKTPLIAAMRCFVASKFGEEVEG